MSKLVMGIVIVLFLMNAGTALWTEHVIVYAYDKANRPIQGAEIEIKYQREKFPITTENFDGSLTGTTNADGAFQATFYNQVYAEDKTLRQYVVFAKYFGKYNSTTITCTSPEKLNCSFAQPNTISLSLPVYRASITATDQNNIALKDVIVTTAQLEAKTDASGKTFFELPEKQAFEVTGVYKGLSKKVSVKLEKDANISLVFPLYNVLLRITDENGNALDALATLGSESKQTRGIREISFNWLALRNATLTVEARGKTKKYELAIDKDLTKEITFDGTPPKISGVELKENAEGKLDFTARVADEGIKAAGLKEESPVTANYSTGGAWSTTQMYPLGDGKFKATLQKPNPGETIKARVIAADAEGNAATSEEASFRVRRIGEENTGGGETPASGESFNYGWIVVGLIVLVVIVLVAKKVKEEFSG